MGKSKYGKGKQKNHIWVFGGVERDSNKCFAIIVNKRNQKELMPIIKKNILPGSIIYSDGWKAYNNLKKYGYKHKVINHSKHFAR